MVKEEKKDAYRADGGGAAMKKTETKSTVLLGHHLKALKLPTMHAECEKVARRCAAENVDHLGFLLQLCELELIERERRSAERRLKAARFPTVKTLESFDFAAAPELNKPQVLELRGASTSSGGRTSCWSAGRARARRTWRRRWASRRAAGASGCGSTGSPS
jgi:hypothetical protein